jgi:hypothetical protein
MPAAGLQCVIHVPEKQYSPKCLERLSNKWLKERLDGGFVGPQWQNVASLAPFESVCGLALGAV